jgi:hypothetical protein
VFFCLPSDIHLTINVSKAKVFRDGVFAAQLMSLAAGGDVTVCSNLSEGVGAPAEWLACCIAQIRQKTIVGSALVI